MDKQKLEVVMQVASKEKSVAWGAAKLKKSKRTIKRYVKRLLADKGDNLIHKNRGRTPPNKKDWDLIWMLYTTKYSGLNILFFCEKLLENEGIKISEGTVRKIFKSHNCTSPKAWRKTKNETRKKLRELKKKSQQQEETLVALETEPYTGTAHPTQPRSKYFGEELQMDASEHLWFGNIKTYLHTAIDDATGMIVGAWLDTQETRIAYYQVTLQFLVSYGIPVVIKTDRRTVFEYKKSGGTDIGKDTMTQYQHVCMNLGIELKCSSVAQFKPRVERSFQTLQGRLPQELKEAGVTTIEAANEFLTSYLQKFNRQFAITNYTESCWAPQPSREQIEQILVTFHSRIVDAGNGIKFRNEYLGTFDRNGRRVLIQPKTRVSIIEMMDGRIFAMHNDCLLALEKIPERQEKSSLVDFDFEKPIVKEKYIPPYDSIWRITNSNLFRKKSYFF